MSPALAESERPTPCTLDVRIWWGSSVLAARSFGQGSDVLLGDHPASLVRLPPALLGANWLLLARRSEAAERSYEVRIPAGAAAKLMRGAETQRLHAPVNVATAPGDRIEIVLGDFRIELGHDAVSARVPSASVGERITRGAFRHVAGAALLHAAFFTIFAYQRPALAGEDDPSMRGETLAVLRQYLVAAAMRERDSMSEEPSDSPPSNAPSGGGARAADTEGARGNIDSAPTYRRVKLGPIEPTMVEAIDRGGQLRAATSFGLIGLLASANTSSAPAADWRVTALDGPVGAFGDMWTADIGEAAGSGGLGIFGAGLGGGGPGNGIGLDPGDLIGVGRAFGSSGDGGIGGRRGCAGCGLGAHAVATPRWRVGRVEVNGRIPGEVIQRVVRNNMGRFRGCYEAGLRDNPALAGRVVTRFAIDRQGLVASAQDGGSALPDPRVVSCVVKAFYSLSFPEHEGGIVTVVYPLSLEPS